MDRLAGRDRQITDDMGQQAGLAGRFAPSPDLVERRVALCGGHLLQGFNFAGGEGALRQGQRIARFGGVFQIKTDAEVAADDHPDQIGAVRNAGVQLGMALQGRERSAVIDVFQADSGFEQAGCRSGHQPAPQQELAGSCCTAQLLEFEAA